MRLITWVIVPTKFCNLRCGYCYEWNELGSRERMTEGTLRKVLESIRDYHQSLVAKGESVVTSISWLGGELLILPNSYFEDLMRLEREVFGKEALLNGSVQNVIQTNLYSLREDMIEFLKREDWIVGVSLDLVPGVRLTARGTPTEDSVIANVKRLRDAGIEPSAILVLAKHTAAPITDLYDKFLSMGFRSLRVLPLFDGPSDRPKDLYETSSEVLVDAMCRLFEHWMATGMKLHVSPLDELFGNVLRKRAKIAFRLLDRGIDGEFVLLVNKDARVYQLIDAYEIDRAMGHLGEQSILDILASDQNAKLLERDRALQSAVCSECPYSGYCNGAPLFESPRSEKHGKFCQFAYPVQKYLEAYLDDARIGEPELASLLMDLAAQDSVSA